MSDLFRWVKTMPAAYHAEAEEQGSKQRKRCRANERLDPAACDVDLLVHKSSTVHWFLALAGGQLPVGEALNIPAGEVP